MVETPNTQDFLFLKQLLCMLSLVRMRRIVKIGALPFEREDLVSEASKVVTNIRENLTMPVTTLRTGKTAVNFRVVTDAVNMIVDRPGDNEIRKIVGGQLQESQVYSRPNKQELFDIFKNDFCSNEELFSSREAVGVLMDAGDRLFHQLTKYINDPKSEININMAVAAVNMIETIDFAFSLSEDGENVFFDEELLFEGRNDD